MLNWLKRKKNPEATWESAVQPPNQAFPFPKGMKLRATEETIVALPKALFGDDETIGSVLHCDEDAGFGTHNDRNAFLVKLQRGMTMSLSRSSEAMLLADDGRNRSVEIMQAPVDDE